MKAVENCSPPRGAWVLPEGLSWSVIPDTGVVRLSEESHKSLFNPESFEQCYALDPEPIARGQFAVVHHCIKRSTGEEFAAKFSSRRRLGSDVTEDLVHEIAVGVMLRGMTSAVRLVDVFCTEAQVILVMEYAPGGDLQTMLDENIVLYERDVINFLRQLLHGLVYIHDRGIVHLDIKPQNLVMLGEYPTFELKLCDFEVSRIIDDLHQVRGFLGTQDYVAPEILHYEPITTKSDMWSVGVLTYALLTGFLPFGGETDQETLLSITRCEYDFPPELFEDITPLAIDFIKKLLVRVPEHRMSACDCLNHPWMQNGSLRIPATLPFETSSLPFDISPESNVIKQQPTIITSSETSSNFEETPSKYSNANESKDSVGRPPIHPSASQQKSLPIDITPVGTPVASTPGAPSAFTFVYRQESRAGSRQNLDKLKSLSKSREVLSERIQMSNLKKLLSKSRERLFDGRISLSKSREELMNCKSFSQSMEALSVLSQLSQHGNALYQSCSNIFFPKGQLPKPNPANSGRMYNSMAAIDKLDVLDCSKMGYFESKITLDESNMTDIVTQRNTDMNSYIGEFGVGTPTFEHKYQRGLRGNTCRGGRGGDSCDKRCTRHRQAEAQSTFKVTNKVSRSEKMKKGAQKRRKERQQKQDKERRASLDSELAKIKMAARNSGSDGSTSPTNRRGSVSHIEQRLQERHERLQERLEKQEKEEHRTSTPRRRRSSFDIDRPHGDRSPKSSTSSLGVSSQRPRSATPTRRKKNKKDSPSGSDVSQASSLESVEVQLDVTHKSHKVKNVQVPEIKISSEENNNNTNKKTDSRNDSDEAYVSLEETLAFKDNLLSPNPDGEHSSADEKDDVSSSTSEEGLENLPVSEKIQNFEKLLQSIQKPYPTSMKLTVPCSLSHSSGKELTVIAEESSPEVETTKVSPNYFRSISNTSDFSSVVSDTSTEKEEDMSLPRTPPESDSEAGSKLSPRMRPRSLSVHSTSSTGSITRCRSRSNSLNYEGDKTSPTRPWGNICSGAVARAMEKFNLKPSDNLDHEAKKRRQSSPTISPCGDHAPSIQ